MPYGPARTDLLEFAHLGVRSLNQPAPACRNWAFASLQTSLPTSAVRFQFCKFALRRLAGGAPGIYPLHSCANLLQFLSGLGKSAFLLRKPPFCYNYKKKFDFKRFSSQNFLAVSKVFYDLFVPFGSSFPGKPAVFSAKEPYLAKSAKLNKEVRSSLLLLLWALCKRNNWPRGGELTLACYFARVVSSRGKRKKDVFAECLARISTCSLNLTLISVTRSRKKRTFKMEFFHVMTHLPITSFISFHISRGKPSRHLESSWVLLFMSRMPWGQR